MSSWMYFERLPDEIILNICQYLRSADVFYSFFNLNSRLNVTISDYFRYVNIMTVSYRQFEYATRHVLPQIGSLVRSFVLNGNWETIINKNLFSILYGPSLPLLFPQLQRLTIKWFTSERLLLFLDILANFSYLTELDIRCLKGQVMDLLQLNVLLANNSRLEMISFDHDSIDFDISEHDSSTFYPNIQELSINLKAHMLVPRLFQLVPNVSRLYINTDELLDKLNCKLNTVDLPSLVHLIDFKLRSINLFWTFEEITHLLHAMPSLQRLTIDIRTDDRRLVTEEDFQTILPLSLKKFDFFIRYYYPELEVSDETSMSFAFTRFPTLSLLDKPRRRFLIHTIPFSQPSAILTGTISNQMPQGWTYTQKIQSLYIYDIASITDILLMLQHFRRLRILSIDLKKKSETLTSSSQSQSTRVNLPHLKQIEVSGKLQLSPILNGTPNVEYMIIYFDCLKILLDDENTCPRMTNRIARLNIIDWSDLESDLLLRIFEAFTSLRHLVIILKEPELVIDGFILRIFSLWKSQMKISIDVKGSISEEVQRNLRQWIIDHSHIQQDQLFAVEYNDNWFDLWL